MMLDPPDTTSLAYEVAKLGPIFGAGFAAAIIVVTLALFAVAIWGLVKSSPSEKVKEPQPG